MDASVTPFSLRDAGSTGIQTFRRWTLWGGCLILGLAIETRAVAEAATLAFTHATLVTSPSAEVQAGRTVLVRGGEITAVGAESEISVPADATVVDCTGRTLVAGFWNCHVHFTEPKWASAASTPAAEIEKELTAMVGRFGFTTVIDLGSDPTSTGALRKRIEGGQVKGPRILTAALPLYPENGIPYYVRETLPEDLVKLMPAPKNAEEARQAVERSVLAGADVIKLFIVTAVRDADHNLRLVTMAPEVASAAVARAHELGLTVWAHPSTVAGVEVCLKAGVDALAHATQDPLLWNEELRKRVQLKGIQMVPTLSLFAPTPNFREVVQEVADFSKAGGKLLFGTDTGFVADYEGNSREYAHLARAGIGKRLLLEMLTTAPVQLVEPGSGRGEIKTGSPADLVLLSGAWNDDPEQFKAVVASWRSGEKIYSNEPSPTAKAGSAGGTP